MAQLHPPRARRDTRKYQPLTATHRLRAPSVPSLRAWAMDVLLLGAFLAVAGAGSLLLGQDANWDLQNYHYYNAWAWWHGRTFTKDVAVLRSKPFSTQCSTCRSTGW